VALLNNVNMHACAATYVALFQKFPVNSSERKKEVGFASLL
jgi:hypothetical protein